MTSSVYVAVRVPADPLRTFEVFTQEISLWWQPDTLFQIAPGGDGVLAFDPGPGGRLYTTLANGEQFDIGRISIWEPGERLVFGWRHTTFGPDMATEVEVRFEAVGRETRVSIEHRAWDSVPRRHVARHGFPEQSTLQHVSQWWRASLGALRNGLASRHKVSD